MDIMSQLREGMKVVDPDGTEIGTVDRLKAGDPGVVTTEGQTGAQGDTILSEIADAFDDGGPDPQQAARLLRTGYIRIDGKGLFGHDRYVSADDLDRVADDAVWLKPGYRSADA